MKDTFEVPTMMTKEDVTMMILSAKKQAGLQKNDSQLQFVAGDD